MKTIDERTTITRTSGLMALTLHSENFSGIIKGHFHLATPARGSLYSVILLTQFNNQWALLTLYHILVIHKENINKLHQNYDIVEGIN